MVIFLIAFQDVHHTEILRFRDRLYEGYLIRIMINQGINIYI